MRTPSSRPAERTGLAVLLVLLAAGALLPVLGRTTGVAGAEPLRDVLERLKST